MMRFRDVLLSRFASIALKHGFRPIRVHKGKDMVNGIQGKDGLILPGGDIVIAGRSGVAVVDVGKQGGALSILRCWHYLSAQTHAHLQSVTLFYVAITRPGQDNTQARALWDFAAKQAHGALDALFEMHRAECGHPPVLPQQPISPATLAACEGELQAQGFCPAFDDWLAREASGSGIAGQK